MMARVRVVTDSACDIDPAVAQQLELVIVPLQVHLGGAVYRDWLDLSPAEFFHKVTSQRGFPTASAPSPHTFREVYRALSREADGILSVHSSARLSQTYSAALAARRAVADRCQIAVIDSQTISRGLGFMALKAAEVAREGWPLNEIAWLVRGMVLQTHTLFLVDNPEYLQRDPRLAQLLSPPDQGPPIKPLLSLEEGKVQLVEEVRTWAKAIEKLYEFVELFPRIEQLAIMHGGVLGEAEGLLRRIEIFFPRHKALITPYGPAVGAHLGPGALGVAVYEGQERRPRRGRWEGEGA